MGQILIDILVFFSTGLVICLVLLIASFTFTVVPILIIGLFTMKKAAAYFCTATVFLGTVIPVAIWSVIMYRLTKPAAEFHSLAIWRDDIVVVLPFITFGLAIFFWKTGLNKYFLFLWQAKEVTKQEASLEKLTENGWVVVAQGKETK